MAQEHIGQMIEESLMDVMDERLLGNAISDEQFAMVLEYYEELLQNPLKINSAGRREFERLLVLSEFQIESILNYRESSGYILSLAELMLLHGFDEHKAAMIAPFISFEIPRKFFKRGDDKLTVGKILQDCSSQLYFKGARELQHNVMFDPITEEEFKKNPDSRYLGTPYYLQMKYKLSYNSKIRAGFTLENDIGEALFPTGGAPLDFFSFNVSVNDIGKINTLILGDYNARFGQGLVLWNSFNLKSAGSPSSLYKKGAGLLPYTSSDESAFFRGIAASFSIGRLDIDAMFSYNRLDARVKDGKYTSIIDDGLHNTCSSLETRKSMHETVGALSLSYMLRRAKIGFTLASYGYDKANGRRITEYNRYQMYDGIWGNASVDFYAVVRNLRFFGELAIDCGGSAAVLVGSLFPINDKMECGILLRSYSKSYIAPHGGAYSTLSSLSNQTGATLDLLYNLSRCMKFSLYAQTSYYPWKRYNAGTSSYMLKGGAKLEFENDLWSGYVNLSNTYHSFERIDKFYLKCKLKYNFSPELNGTLHGAFVSTGGGGYEVGTDWRYRGVNRRFTVNGGVTLFSCRDWDSRLYVYENDLPYTYSSRLLYGDGASLYLLLNYDFKDGVGIYLKNGTQCYFSNNRESRYELKFAIKIGF